MLNNMEKNFDIVEYPLKIKNEKNLIFCKNKLKYEFRILETAESKKVFCTKKKTQFLYLYLEIKETECLIENYTHSIYTFDSPLDFYVDQTCASPFYRNLCDALINENINEAFKIDLSIPFPPYVPPVINFSDTPSKLEKLNKNFVFDKIRSKITRVHYNDLIPNTKLGVKYKNDDQIRHVCTFIEEISQKIIKMSQIQKFFKIYKKKNNLSIKSDMIKQYMPFFRYHVMDGPFRKTWIVFGYDPKSDINNYKFQIIDIRTEGTFLHLYECPDIIAEVEKNREWYLKEDCDFKNGFFKQALSQLVLYYKYIRTSTSSEEDCFEILE